MATTNDRNIILDLNKSSEILEDNRTLTEAYENCEHNKSKFFIHSIMNIDNDKYMTLIYENSFKKDIFDNILTVSNTNNNRTNSGIATKGLGSKHIMHKYAKGIEIISINEDKQSWFYHTFNLSEHVDELKNNKNIDVKESYNKRSYQVDSITLDKLLRNNYEIKKIFNTVNNEIENYNNTDLCENKINKPFGYIFIQLNDKYRNMTDSDINKIFDDFRTICEIKYINKLDNIPYFIHKEIGEYKEFNKIKKRDVLFHKDAFDKFTWYIKKIDFKKKIIQLVYINVNSDYYYFKYIPTKGTKLSGSFQIVNEDNNIDLYEICKNYTPKNCDHSYECYSIGESNKDTLRSNITPESIENYTGFYYLLDDIILNHRPQDTSHILGAQSRNTPGGSKSRHIVKIYNKDKHDVRAIKSEFTLKDKIDIFLIKDLNKILNEINNNKWRNMSHEYKRHISPKAILEYFEINNKKVEKKKVISKNDNNKKVDDPSIYLILYGIPNDNKEYDTNDFDYLFKFGFTKQDTEKRIKQNNNKIKLPIISTHAFRLKDANINELQILKYIRSKTEFLNIKEGGKLTERFYCKLEHFIELDNIINRFKYLVIDDKLNNWGQFASQYIED